MKKKMGALVSFALTLALILSLATTALASSGCGQKGNSSGNYGGSKTKAMSAQTGTSGKGPSDKAPAKGLTEPFEFMYTKNRGNAVGMAADVVKNAIAALSDEDKETLSDEIEAYEEAVAAAKEAMASAEKGDDLSEYREAVVTALKELLKAAKEADIDLKAPMSSAASMNGQLHRNRNGKDFSNTVEEALAALSDEDKETLSDYIEAYETALAEAKEAKENAVDGDDLSASQEAVMTALKELLEAAKEADIDLGLKPFPVVLKDGKNLYCPTGVCFTDAIEEAIAALDDDDKDTLSEYIEAYEDAVAKAETAAENADEDDDLSDYREAVVAALRELLNAAKEADIDLGLLKTAGR
ncbi:hypothetical protein SDC9_58598 [bioreactor metagenome]|uniref:Uncharacterized protein n=1 Tax=bioreactor metagenome TaxID=1076179 RepID=A0A644X7T6_9ZZZZ